MSRSCLRSKNVSEPHEDSNNGPTAKLNFGQNMAAIYTNANATFLAEYDVFGNAFGTMNASSHLRGFCMILVDLTTISNRPIR